jgi:hypothetical protein
VIDLIIFKEEITLIYTIVCIILAIIILSIISIKLRVEYEKFYFINILLYFLISASRMGLIPFGFMFCLLVMFTHSEIKNRKAKIVAIALGFLLYLSYIVTVVFHV